jgi:hypothetical protein
MIITGFAAAVFAQTPIGQQHDDQEYSRPDLDGAMDRGHTGRVLVLEKP